MSTCSVSISDDLKSVRLIASLRVWGLTLILHLYPCSSALRLVNRTRPQSTARYDELGERMIRDRLSSSNPSIAATVVHYTDRRHHDF